MLVGYNTNISYKDNVYHIQTEDSGQSNPVIVTLLYSKGAILASKKTNYTHILTDPDYREKVRKMMKIQHKSMIKELLSGKYTGESEEESEVLNQVEGVREVKEEKETGEVKGEVQQIEPEETPQEITDSQEGKEEAKDQITKGLDDVLLNYILKRKN